MRHLYRGTLAILFLWFFTSALGGWAVLFVMIHVTAFTANFFYHKKTIMKNLKNLVFLFFIIALYACPQVRDESTGRYFVDNQTADTLFLDAVSLTGGNIIADKQEILPNSRQNFFETIHFTKSAVPPSDVFSDFILRTNTDTLFNGIDDEKWTNTLTDIDQEWVLSVE